MFLHYLLFFLLYTLTCCRPRTKDSWFHEMEPHNDGHTPRSSVFYNTFKHMQAGMNMYAPALHTGTIYRGNFQKPELLHPKYRAMGWDSDFSHKDADAFK